MRMRPRTARRPAAPPNEALIAAAVLAALAASAAAQRQFGRLSKQALPDTRSDTRVVVLGDVDGDGDLDFVAGNGSYFAKPDHLHLNDGRGVFTDVSANHLPGTAHRTRAIAWGDVDGDSDLDLIVGTRTRNRLYLNDGNGDFTDATGGRLPNNSRSTFAAALADIDGDGDLDFVGGSYSGANELYLNDGSGIFEDVSAAQMPSTSRTWSMALGDVDGDGDLDVVFGNRDRQNDLLLNDGNGNFTVATASRLPADRDYTYSVALADVDGDNDLDLLAGNIFFESGSQNRLYLNDGNGFYSDATAARLPAIADNTAALAVGDLDGDGDVDVVVGNRASPSGGQNRLLLNDGNGFYSDASIRMPGDRDITQAVALGDVDGDGDLDIACGNGYTQGYYVGKRNRLYLNDGAANFVDATAPHLPADGDRTSSLVLGDVDGDGDLDLITGNSGQWYVAAGEQNRLYLNDGSGRFTDATTGRMPIATNKTYAIALGDLDGDGDLDLVLGNGGQNRLLRNDGSGVFTDDTAGRMPSASDATGALAIGDVDGDGDLDLVVGNSGTLGGQDRLYLNDGSGYFTDHSTNLPAAPDNTNAAALQDLDSDGDLDLVIGNYLQQNRLYLNDGSGNFTDATARLPIENDGCHSMAFGDVDGDGDLDMVAGNSYLGFYNKEGQQNRLYLNDGSATFTEATAGRLPLVPGLTMGVVLGDVDGDSDLDLVTSNGYDYRGPYGSKVQGSTEQTRLYLNDGTGAFTDATATRFPNDPDYSNAVTLGDVDGDGDLDVLVGNYLQQNKLFLNLLRQLDTPLLPRVGQQLTLDVYARYDPSTSLVALPVVSGSPAAFPLPHTGAATLDPARTAALHPIPIPAATGMASANYAVPNLPSLVGAPIHAQALLLPPVRELRLNATSNGLRTAGYGVGGHSAARLTNVTSDVILD